jgi:UDP-glucose 4-epimerase
MKILITGADGFIGSHLVQYCLQQGHEVLGLDKQWMNDHPFLDNKNWEPSTCNIVRDDGFLGMIFSRFKPDVCFHLAAYASEGRSNHIRSFIHSNNTVGTANVINACVNHKCKLIFTSSVAIYSGDPPFSEEELPNPVDEYGLSKYMSERSIMIAGEHQGLNWNIIRPRNVYGPSQNIFDRSRNLFGIWCYNALNGLPLTIFGDGSNRRAFTYIDDLIPPLYRAMDINQEIVNLGSDVSFSIKEAAEVFTRVTGYNAIEYVEPRPEVPVALCTASKSYRLLGWSTNTSLVDGISKMWEWVQTVPMRSLDKMPDLEVSENAHSSLL